MTRGHLVFPRIIIIHRHTSDTPSSQRGERSNACMQLSPDSAVSGLWSLVADVILCSKIYQMLNEHCAPVWCRKQLGYVIDIVVCRFRPVYCGSI